MKIQNVTTAVILDKRFKKLDETFPVKLRVTFRRVQKYYALGVSLSENDYNKTMGDKPREQFKQIRKKITDIAERADEIKAELPEFSFEAFEKKFLEPSTSKNCLFASIEAIKKRYFQAGSVSTSSLYQSTLQSLKLFTGKETLNFEKVTPKFLNEYEKWMIKQGNSMTTISMYLRSVRATMNEAEKQGIITKQSLPFGREKYEIPGSVNVKKALTTNEIAAIFNYPAEEQSSMQRYKDYWLFSYLCNGMNIKDMARLKFANIDSEAITFERAKTKSKNRKSQKNIVVPLTIEIARIIDRWGNKSANPQDYVFPILESGVTPAREMALIKQTTKMINKYMKIIVQNAGISKKVTTYTARHSFATVLKQAGASIEFISESLGHSNITTTENYLASFELDKKKQFANELTKFLNNERI